MQYQFLRLYLQRITNTMNTYQLYTALTNSNQNSASSCYFEVGDKVVRISNHLPNTTNFELFNEGANKIFMIFISNDLTEGQIEKFIENEMSENEVDYMLIGEDFNDVDYISSRINRF